VAQLGQKRFGRIPRVGDAFCGGGSIPFEASRIGCEAYASDLNPVAALLTWSALNIVGGGPEVAAQVRESQEEIYAAVDRQICHWGIEHKTEDLSVGEWDSLAAKIADGSLTPAQLDEQVWRADAYLYCVEVRCPETGWLVPLAPSWVIGEKTKAIARLIPIPEEKRYRIDILSGVSAAEMAEAKQGTIAKGKIIHPVLLEQGRDPGTIEQARLLSSRDLKKTPTTHHPNGLRLWENNDLVPRPDDVFQERLYCVRWVESYRNAKGDLRTRKHYREVTPADQAREEKALELLCGRFADWQSQGFLPTTLLTPDGKTDEPIRTRGWTHWHHIFHPRQLLVYGWALANSSKDKNHLKKVTTLLAVSRCTDWSCRLTQWDASAANEKVSHVFSNHALNTSFSSAWRGWKKLKRNWCSDLVESPVEDNAKIELKDARLVSQNVDFWITDPPYAGAINYHELTEFFLSWQAGQIPSLFPSWYTDTHRALAVTGNDENFRSSMVDCYKAMCANMADDGLQVIMFTHQNAGVWADLALIVWAAGLRVSAAWCIATETDSSHKKDANYVQSTVLLILRKQTSVDVAFLDEVYPEVEDEVKRQLDAMHDLDDPHADAPDFGDTDYQLAAYAAALRVLTRYRAIEDIDVARELSRPRTRGQEPSPLEGAITNAVRIACDHLVPPGIERSIWRALGSTERFYLKGLDLESRGEQRSGAYQELARGFGLRDYQELLASAKANEVRLLTPTAFGKKLLRGDKESFASSLLRHALFAIREVAASEDGAEPGRQWLRTEVTNYWNERKTLIALLTYLARFEQSLPAWEADAKAAKLLAGALENDH
jgi:adenine-specific DNA methylase